MSLLAPDSQLVAPVRLANGSTIGAGSTITDNVNENELAISRVRQQHIQVLEQRKKVTHYQ